MMSTLNCNHNVHKVQIVYVALTVDLMSLSNFASSFQQRQFPVFQ